MVSVLMITRLALRGARLRLDARLAGVCLAIAASLMSATCDRVPLLAPSGSTIILTASNNVIAANGTAQLTAQLLEPAGTPPHPGTHVIFTTTLGVIEPAEVETDINGRAVATFRANGQNGTATISAASGAARTDANGSVRISIGTAAVGRITLTANPTTISATGGTAVVTANVVDLNGNGLSGAPVSFATSAGVLSSALVNTDSSGNAQTSLQTSVEATVTATVGAPGTGGGTGGGGGTNPPANGGGGTGGGGSTSSQTSATVTVKVNPLPTVSITAGSTGSTAFQAGTPVPFTISAQPGTNSTAQIREVVVNFGDGTAVNLGAVSGTTLSVQHRYDEGGTFTVTVRVTDTLGTVVNAATVIVVLDQAPLAVSISKATTQSGPNNNYTLTATVTPSSIIVSNYRWTVDGNQVQSGGNNVLTLSFLASANHLVAVEVTTSTGVQASASVFLP